MCATGVNSEGASELWATARKLAEILPGEKTERAWLDHAKRENWVIRKAEPRGRGRGATEFLVPTEVRALIAARRHTTPAEIAGQPVPGVEKALEALANPRAYVAYDSAGDGDQNWALLEVLLRFAERRLTHDVTVALLDRIDQVVAAWSPVAAGRPDLAARLARVKSSVDLLRLADQ